MKEIEEKTRMNIGIIGFGRFGKLLATILLDDFSVLVYDNSKTDEDIMIEAIFSGISVNPAPVSEVASCKNVFLCVPILKFEEALQEYKHYFSKGATIIDVLSVKEHPLKLMTEVQKDCDIEILLTHPMFGPDAVAEDDLKDQPIVICPEKTSKSIVSLWCEYFKRKGLRVVEMSCEEHDILIARSLCLTHLLGRVVDRIGISASNIDTKDFENLLKIREHVCKNSLGLYRGLHQKNQFAEKMRTEMMEALGKEIENSLL